MRLTDKLGWLAALMGAAFLADGSQTERGGGRTADTATEIVVSSHDATPLETVPPPSEDLDIGAPVDEPGPDAGTPATAPVSDCQCSDCNCEDCQCSGGECKCEGCEDVPPPPDEPVAAAQPEQNLADYLHELTIYGGEFPAKATCVYLGGGEAVTAFHVIAKNPRPSFSITINGTEHYANSYVRYEKAGLLIVRFTLTDEPPAAPVATDAPQYMSAGTVLGFGTDLSLHEGVIAAYGLLALDPHDAGVDLGDSGGGVFIDGKLVGVLDGYETNPADSDHRVVYFQPLFGARQAFAGDAVASPSASTSARPVVLLYVTDGCAHCVPWETLAEDDDHLPFDIQVRQGDRDDWLYPHFHVVDRGGQERCAGTGLGTPNDGGLARLTDQWEALRQ